MADDELIGKTIGGYDIQGRIGEGGMATVYLARQQSMNRKVALKMLPKQFIKDSTYIQRFEREVAIVSQLEHRSIVPVYDYGEYDGQPYIVMRYMPAGSVDDMLVQGPLRPNEILGILRQIAPALDYAHQNDVLHRDLKPSNVLMDDGGGAFLTDFGIARVLGEQSTGITTQGVVGTPSYMSPEQAQGKDLDGRSDVYALGVMLFEMATGKRPFESETPYSIAVMQVTTPPPSPCHLNPALSTAVEKVILKALNKPRDKRYQSAQELADALQRAIENPDSLNDTNPSVDRREFADRIENAQAQARAATTSPPAQRPVYNTPPPSSNTNSRPIPSRGIRSKLRKQRKENPLVSAVIGGAIGCGFLAVFVAVGFFLLSFLLPPTPRSEANATARTVNRTLAPAVTDTPDSAAAVASATLDVTQQTALARLQERNRNNDATATANAVASDSAPTRTPGIDPVGVRGTPSLLPPLQDVSGRLVYADRRGEDNSMEIATLNLDTWASTQLTDLEADSSYPIPSPDGRWIAFQSDRDGDFEIYVMNTGGGQIQQLTDNTYLDRIAAWSPDGEWIVYSSDDEQNNRYDLRRVRLDGSVDELVFSNEQRKSHPRYSPDGRYLIFTMGTNPNDASTWEIARLDLETDELMLLTNNDTRDASAVFSPDGETILYVTYDGNSNALATMDINGENQRVLYDTSGSDWAANYSPDGEYIVFTSNVNDTDQLFLMTANGESVQQITADGGLYASWIPQR